MTGRLHGRAANGVDDSRHLEEMRGTAARRLRALESGEARQPLGNWLRS